MTAVFLCSKCAHGAVSWLKQWAETSVPATTSNTASPAVRLIAVELLAIAGTVHAGMLEAVAAVLAGGPTPNGSPGAIAFDAIRSGWALPDAAHAMTHRAIAVQLCRRADLDDRMAVGLALHRAARVLEADDEQL